MVLSGILSGNVFVQHISIMPPGLFIRLKLITYEVFFLLSFFDGINLKHILVTCMTRKVRLPTEVGEGSL